MPSWLACVSTRAPQPPTLLLLLLLLHRRQGTGHPHAAWAWRIAAGDRARRQRQDDACSGCRADTGGCGRALCYGMHDTDTSAAGGSAQGGCVWGGGLLLLWLHAVVCMSYISHAHMCDQRAHYHMCRSWRTAARSATPLSFMQSHLLLWAHGWPHCLPLQLLGSVCGMRAVMHWSCWMTWHHCQVCYCSK